MSDPVLRDLEEIATIEQRDRQLLLLTIVVLVAIAGVLAFVMLTPPTDIGTLYQSYRLVGVPILIAGFLVLIALFAVYVVDRKKRLSRIAERAIHLRIVHAALERRTGEIAGLVKGTSLANIKRGFGGVLDLIVKASVRHLGADQASVMLVKEGSLELEFKATFGSYPAEILKLRVQVGEGVAGHVVQEGKPMLMHDEADASRFVNLRRKTVKVSSGMLAPIRVEDRVIGVISISRFGNRRRFDQSDLQFLIMCSDLAADAIEKAALYRKLRQRMASQEPSEKKPGQSAQVTLKAVSE